MVKLNSIGGSSQGKGIEQKGIGKANTDTLSNTQQQGSLLKGKSGDQLSLNNDYLGIQRESKNISNQQSAPAYDETVETPEYTETSEATETDETNQATEGSKGKGKGKGAGRIPPGIAKKSSADLPDGNPWKAVLEQREADAAEQVKKQKESEAKKLANEQKAKEEEKLAKEEDAKLMTDLLALMQTMMATMEQLRKPAVADSEKPAEDGGAAPVGQDTTTDKPAAPAETKPAPDADIPVETNPTLDASAHEAVTTGPLDDPAKLQQEIQSFNHFDAGNTEALVKFLNGRFPETSFTIQGEDLKYTLDGKDFLIAASGESFPR